VDGAHFSGKRSSARLAIRVARDEDFKVHF